MMETSRAGLGVVYYKRVGNIYILYCDTAQNAKKLYIFVSNNIASLLETIEMKGNCTLEINFFDTSFTLIYDDLLCNGKYDMSKGFAKYLTTAVKQEIPDNFNLPLIPIHYPLH